MTYSVYQHYLTERNLEVDAFLYQMTNTMLLLDDILDNGVRINDDFVLQNVTKDGGTRVTFGAYPGKISQYSTFHETFRTQQCTIIIFGSKSGH